MGMRTTIPDLLLQEGCQGTDKLLLVDVFHCDTRHLHDAERKLMHNRGGRPTKYSLICNRPIIFKESHWMQFEFEVNFQAEHEKQSAF